MDIIDEAIKKGRSSLSEFEAKQLLAAYRIPTTREILVESEKNLLAAAAAIGYPLVLKGCSADIAHKTEKNLVRIDIRNDQEAVAAFRDISAGMEQDQIPVLVQEMIQGQRELAAGLVRDARFGACVMFGLGGIFTEVLEDVSFRVAPLKRLDALEMMREIKGHKILTAVRGMEAVDINALADILVNIGRVGLDHRQIKEIDINPIIISGSRPIVVDALVLLDNSEE